MYAVIYFSENDGYYQTAYLGTSKEMAHEIALIYKFNYKYDDVRIEKRS